MLRMIAWQLLSCRLFCSSFVPCPSFGIVFLSLIVSHQLRKVRSAVFCKRQLSSDSFSEKESLWVREELEVVNEKSQLAVPILRYMVRVIVSSLPSFFLVSSSSPSSYSSSLPLFLKKTYTESKATHSPKYSLETLDLSVPLPRCGQEYSNRFIFSPMMIWNHKNLPLFTPWISQNCVPPKQTNKLSFHWQLLPWWWFLPLLLRLHLIHFQNQLSRRWLVLVEPLEVSFPLRELLSFNQHTRQAHYQYQWWLIPAWSHCHL